MYDYQMQYPDMRISNYTPRTVKPGQLSKVEKIEVDTTSLVRTNDGVMWSPAGPNSDVCASWLSAVIGGHAMAPRFRAPQESLAFLGKTEYNFARSCECQLSRHAALSAIIAHLNRIAAQSGWQFHLQRVPTWERVQLALMESLPVMAGGSVYSSFEKAKASGIVPMPKPDEDLLGGQMISILAFDTKTELAKAAGHMGIAQGIHGLFTYRGSHLRHLGIFRDFFVLVPRYGDAK